MQLSLYICFVVPARVELTHLDYESRVLTVKLRDRNTMAFIINSMYAAGPVIDSSLLIYFLFFEYSKSVPVFFYFNYLVLDFFTKQAGCLLAFLYSLPSAAGRCTVTEITDGTNQRCKSFV